MFLEINNLHKKYNNVEALKGISFAVPKGSVFGLLGPNGAGKTTFIRILTSIISYDQGEILFDGQPLSPEHTRHIGYLPEERGLYKKMAVGEQIVYFAQLKGMDKSQATKRAKELLRKFEMLGWWHKKVQELSKGMQQKVQFVITLIHNPQLLIFDEPFSGFDPINQELLKSEIRELHQQGKTILFSTHNMASVEEVCDSMVLINKGQILLQGKIDDIKRQFTKNLYIIEFREPTIEFTSNDDFEIIEQNKSQFKIKIKDGKTPNDLLLYASRFGTITRFEELLPTLNEIFISTVKNS